MQLILNKLSLENFKGIGSLELNFQEGQNNIAGENATGKTTIADAFYFLLFGTNSAGSANFHIKPLQEDGQVKHNLETMVEGRFKTNYTDPMMIEDIELHHSTDIKVQHFLDDKLTLKRVYKEKWTKPRDSIEKEFSGHTTKYYMDDEVVTKRVYDDTIKRIIDMKIFKLLSDPLYFSEKIPMENRREIIMSALGATIDFEKIIEKHPEFARVPKLCKTKSEADRKKQLKTKKASLNEDINAIPLRIDEQQRTINLMQHLEKPEELEAERRQIAEKIADLSGRLNQFDAKREDKVKTSEIQKEIMDLDADIVREELKLTTAEQEFDIKRQRKLEDLRLKHISAKHNIQDLQYAIEDLEKQIKKTNKDIEKRQERRQELIKEWQDIDSMEISQNQTENTCKVCGQALPENMIEDQVKKLKKSQADNLARINEIGRENKKKIESLESKTEKIRDKIKEYNNKIDVQIQIKRAKAKEYDQEREQKFTGKLSMQYHNLSMKKEGLVEKLNQLKAQSNNTEDQKQKDNLNEALKEQENKLQGVLQRIQDRKSQDKTKQSAKARIAELEKEHQKLAEKHNILLGDIQLLEDFIRAKASMLEKIINDQIEFANIRLFENQVNGGLKEICEIEVGGVPFGSLNNAARINAGLSIIAAISGYYNFFPPIWIDGAESILKIMDMKKQQVVALRVQEGKEKITLN